MKDEVVQEYVINRKTMALIPAFHFEFCTIALESGREYFVKRPPLELIKAACLNGGSDYNGRRSAVKHKTGMKRKLPIPVDIDENIFAFPTFSPAHPDCSWIMLSHVDSIVSDRKVSSGATILTFKNGHKINLKLRSELVQKQLYRTSYCMTCFASKWNGNDSVYNSFVPPSGTQ
ncbi:competence protein ComK [Evansella clarkii]|uniref:competence protein ComK n=1 Tax=Evansella clarkii TaxID=79879 RepID=UPI000B43D4FA|nr:competence protein ComK [Evansella clarkii]